MIRAKSEAGAERFLDFFEAVRTLHHQETGARLEAYKPTEPQCVAEVFESLWDLDLQGEVFVGEFLHRMAWSQCLENANHRTSILFLQSFLDAVGVSFPRYAEDADARQRFDVDINEWTGRSKALMRRRGEPAYSQSRLAPEHRRMTCEWVAGLLDLQSMVLTTVGPQRLMTFLS